MLTLVTSSQLIKFLKEQPFVMLNNTLLTEELSPELVDVLPSSSITPKMDSRPESDSHLARERPSQASAEP